MKLDDIYADYCIKIAPIYLHQGSIKKITDENLKSLTEYANSLKENNLLAGFPSSLHNIYFYSAKDGTARLLAHKSSSIEDNINSTILHKNKQYQWLLAEAYEVYEDFLQNIYAFLGYNNNELWPLSDFGAITLNELKTKEFIFFQKQAKNKKDIPHSILSKLREILPKYMALEANNKINKNIKLMIILIEKLRHIIVHCGGVVQDKNEFIEGIFQKAGLFNNGKYDKNVYEFILGFFGDEQYKNTISLIEIPVMPELPIRAEINRVDILINTLSASVHAICEEINEIFVNSGR
jgi:hypothetical protein